VIERLIAGMRAVIEALSPAERRRTIAAIRSVDRKYSIGSKRRQTRHSKSEGALQPSALKRRTEKENRTLGCGKTRVLYCLPVQGKASVSAEATITFVP
jgi:hypothetical protein